MPEQIQKQREKHKVRQNVSERPALTDPAELSSRKSWRFFRFGGKRGEAGRSGENHKMHQKCETEAARSGEKGGKPPRCLKKREEGTGGWHNFFFVTQRFNSTVNVLRELAPGARVCAPGHKSCEARSGCAPARASARVCAPGHKNLLSHRAKVKLLFWHPCAGAVLIRSLLASVRRGRQLGAPFISEMWSQRFATHSACSSLPP